VAGRKIRPSLTIPEIHATLIFHFENVEMIAAETQWDNYLALPVG